MKSLFCVGMGNATPQVSWQRINGKGWCKWKGVVESVARVQRSSGATGFCGRASGIHPSLLA